MASMKLYKPSYSFAATKTNYSESQQEYSSHSNYADGSWTGKVKEPSHDYQAQMGYGSANKSTNYYASAQCAQPSSMINVVQNGHVVETMKSQESNGLQLGGDTTKCFSPTHSSRSEFEMHQEGRIMQESDHGWAKKPNYVSGTAQASQYELSKMEQGWASKPNQYSSPTMGNKQGVIIHEEEHVIEKVESNLVSKPTQLSGPTHANQYGESMYKKQGAEAYDYSEGGVERARAAKPNKYLGPTQSNRSMQNMHNENGQEEWRDNRHEYLSPIRTNALGVHNEDHMMGKMDQGWANSPQNNHSNIGMYQEGHMMGNMGHEAHLPSNVLGPIKNNTGLKVYKDEHTMVNPTAQLPGPTQGNRYGQSMHDGYSAKGGWANQPAKYSSSNQLGYSGHDGFGPSQARPLGYPSHDGFGPSQVHPSDYPGHNGFGPSQDRGLPQNDFGPTHTVAQNGFGAAQVNQSAHGVSQNRFGAAQDNYAAHGVSQNRFGAAQDNYAAHGASQNRFRSAQTNQSAYGVAQKGLNASQVNYSAHGVGQKGFGSAQANQSAYGVAQNGFGSSHNQHKYNDHEEADESVHEIMDEILSKYPAHNVSGGNWAAKPNTYDY